MEHARGENQAREDGTGRREQGDEGTGGVLDALQPQDERLADDDNGGHRCLLGVHHGRTQCGEGVCGDGRATGEHTEIYGDDGGGRAQTERRVQEDGHTYVTRAAERTGAGGWTTGQEHAGGRAGIRGGSGHHQRGAGGPRGGGHADHRQAYGHLRGDGTHGHKGCHAGRRQYGERAFSELHGIKAVSGTVRTAHGRCRGAGETLHPGTAGLRCHPRRERSEGGDVFLGPGQADDEPVPEAHGDCQAGGHRRGEVQRDAETEHVRGTDDVPAAHP